VLDWAGENVVGTFDVESDKPNALSEDVRRFLEACANVIRPLCFLGLKLYRRRGPRVERRIYPTSLQAWSVVRVSVPQKSRPIPDPVCDEATLARASKI